MTLIRGDATTIPLADDSVDLIVTSPPYFALRSYQDSCGTCGGVDPDNGPNLSGPSAKSTLDGSKANRSGTGRVAVEPAQDCPECAGSGRGHYAGQIGSEPTPQQFLEALWAVTAECRRVLKPSGSMFVNLGDKYAGGGGQWDKDERPDPNGLRSSRSTGGIRSSNNTGGKTFGFRTKSLMGLPWRYAIGCIDQLGLILRAEIIWNKPNGLPESVRDRVRRSHEQWFHMVKEPRYYTAIDEIREPHDPAYVEWSRKYAGKYSVTTGGDSGTKQGTEAGSGMTHQISPLGKLPGSVWTVPTEPLRTPDHLPQHFAAFPTEWPRRIILGWSPADGIVLDPFVGTGTTVAVANALGRTGIGIDLSADYLELAKWRCQDPNLKAKVLGLDKPVRQIEGQSTLFA